MKTKLFIFLYCIIFSFCSCHENEATPDNDILSFNVKVGDSQYQGKIDKKLKEIRVGGIYYSSTITDVKYILPKGFSISPDPHSFIGNWEKEMSVIITTASGEKISYKIILKDFKGKDTQEGGRKLVIGYAPGDQYLEKKNRIKWHYLTHLNLAFLQVHADATFTDILQECVKTAVIDAHKNNVKILASVSSDQEKGFAIAIKDKKLRTKLVTDLIQYANTNKLDGIDIDFEIYSEIGPNLFAFIKELYEKKGDLLLTCAVAAQTAYTEQWQQYFDIINIMSYDHCGGTWGDEGNHASYDDAVSDIAMWINHLKAPASKLALGVPFYGYTWDNLPGTGRVKDITYARICALFPAIDVEKTDQIGRTYYNGIPTIRKKCQLALEKNLAGVMIWQIFQDTDIPGKSLMDALGEEINKH